MEEKTSERGPSVPSVRPSVRPAVPGNRFRRILLPPDADDTAAVSDFPQLSPRNVALCRVRRKTGATNRESGLLLLKKALSFLFIASFFVG